jgi:hypothetical protein
LTNLVTILIKGHSAVDSEHFSPLVEPSSWREENFVMENFIACLKKHHVF